MVVLLELVEMPEEELDWLPGGPLPPEVEVFEEELVEVLFELDAVPDEVTLVVELAEEELE